MRDEDPIAEVNCQFCNKNYRVDLNDLLKKDDTSTTYDSSAKKNTAADATAIDQTV